MMRLTYGTLPSKEDFEEFFNNNVEDKYDIILSSLNSQACEGFKLGTGSYSCNDLWEAINETVRIHKLPCSVALNPYLLIPLEELSINSEIRMDLVSSILSSLDIEWV